MSLSLAHWHPDSNLPTPASDKAQYLLPRPMALQPEVQPPWVPGGPLQAASLPRCQLQAPEEL